MGWIIAIIVVVFIINQVSASNKRKRYEERRLNNANRYQDSYTPKTIKNPLYGMELSELFDEYKKASDIPPLDSLVRRAYEKGEITSGRNTFQSLSDHDQKVILRIAINIGHKRKKDKENAETISRKHIANYKS